MKTVNGVFTKFVNTHYGLKGICKESIHTHTDKHIKPNWIKQLGGSTGCTRTLFLPYRRCVLEFWWRDSTYSRAEAANRSSIMLLLDCLLRIWKNKDIAVVFAMSIWTKKKGVPT